MIVYAGSQGTPIIFRVEFLVVLGMAWTCIQPRCGEGRWLELLFGEKEGGCLFFIVVLPFGC